MRERATEFETLGAADFARARAGLLLSDAAPAVLRDDVAAAMAESLRLPGYRWACDSMADTDHAGDLAAIAVPTLVIVGEHDRVTPPRASRLLADGIAGARLSVVAGAGHLANQEDPAAFNDAVAEWADGLAAGALG
ncbi:MAG TPA: hypothetical protein DEP66_01320 [Acidimicrobiaceae bacterium]|nr:hypothetical protein [Acidimicrobiaceae bacterium]